jgi:hypothetical protein
VLVGSHPGVERSLLLVLPGRLGGLLLGLLLLGRLGCLPLGLGRGLGLPAIGLGFGGLLLGVAGAWSLFV